MAKATVRIGDFRAAPGEKTCGLYSVPGIGHVMPLTVVNGAAAGRMVLITSGIHGGEFTGIQATIELARELDPQEISGTVILLHPVNTGAFRQIVPAVVPEAGENLNRLFPGNPDGGYADRLAYHLTHEFQQRADFYIDVHGGDLHEELEPFVFYPGAADPEVTAESRRVAESLNVKYMLRSAAVTGAYNSAAKRGIPSLLIERGGCGLWSRNEVDLYKDDLKSALHALGVYPDDPNENRAFRPVDVARATYLASDFDGCWYPAVRAGERVERGAPLGEIRDFLGTRLAAYRAEISGVVLYHAVSLSVRKGTELVAYAACECN
jgi:Predicted deacylase